MPAIPKRSTVYLCEQDEQRALQGSLRDEPQWRDVLYVEEITLDVAPSAN